MTTHLKIAGLSAVLAAALVAVIVPPPASATVPTGKTLIERAPAAQPVAPRPEALRDIPEDPCAKAVWPYVPRDCLAAAGAPARVARVIAAR